MSIQTIIRLSSLGFRQCFVCLLERRNEKTEKDNFRWKIFGCLLMDWISCLNTMCSLSH